jgi:hypothetical protein
MPQPWTVDPFSFLSGTASPLQKEAVPHKTEFAANLLTVRKEQFAVPAAKDTVSAHS